METYSPDSEKFDATPSGLRMTSWRRRSSSLFYGALSAIFVAAALLATVAMKRCIGAPFSSTPFFFCAMAIFSRFGGFGAGILATILSFLAIGYFLTPPRYSIAFSFDQIPRVAAFGLTGWVVSWLGGRQKRVEAAPARAGDELEERVRELQLQVGLLQHLPVSAWTLKPDGTPDFVNQVWLEFAGQTLDFVRSHPDAWMTAVHPEDREMAAKAFWEGVHSGQGFAMETRSLRAQDGTYRWRLQQAVVMRDSEGKVLKFVGTTTDIDDQKRTEEALRQAQAELAHVTRVTTMGELAASIAHEVNQPIAGVLINGNACLSWLARTKEKSVEIAEVRETVQRIIRDGKRAGEIIGGIRALFKKTESAREPLDVNETIREIVALARSVMNKQRVTLRLELPSDLPSVPGDRVQLQQVMLNLILNAIDAMAAVECRARDLVIQTRRSEEGGVLVTVRDSGLGLDPAATDHIFTAFHTTKPGGLGMGLSISRSIVENHSGRIWATGHDGSGASFHFTLPTTSKAHERRLALHELTTGRVPFVQHGA